MRWTAAASLVLFATQPVVAGPLEDAIALALEMSAEVEAKQHEAEAIARQSAWSSEVRLAYNLKQTDSNAGGLDAGLTVKIPLFDRSREIAAARARLQLADHRQRLKNALVAEAATLVALRVKQVDAREAADFQRDKLAYYKQAVSEGREGAEVLWPVAKGVREAHQAALAATQAYSSELERMARTYGGEAWTRLQDLLAEYARQKLRSMPSAGAATSW